MTMQVGDRVTVYRKVNVEYWVPGMDKFVGKSGTIVAYRHIEESPMVHIDGSPNDIAYLYPKSSLKYEVTNK